MTAPDEVSVGVPAWRVVVALLFVAALVAGLVAVSGREPEAASPSATAILPPAPETAQSSTAGAAMSLAPAVPAETDSSAPEAPFLAAVRNDLEAALAAWGLFAATGEIDAVDGRFAPDGPQYAQLLREVDDRVANAPGLPAFEFSMPDPVVLSSDPNAVVLTGEVIVTRPGIAPESYRWDIELRRDEEQGRWVLWTVASASG